MPNTTPEYWFLEGAETQRSPAFTTGNSATAFVDGMGYMADLHATIGDCDQSLLIAGWRISNDQILNPHLIDEKPNGQTVIAAITGAAMRGCSVKALLFNVPGTEAPGPFRFWHAKDNHDFARALKDAGGEAVLDSRLAPVPASAHHQKFIIATSKEASRNAAYVGGIDICLDRWDRSSHDAPGERQCDFVRAGGIETHTPSQPGWHDIQVKLQGPAVEQIWQVFRARWNDRRPANHNLLLKEFASGTALDDSAPTCAPAGSQAVQVNLTLPAGMFPKAGGAGDFTVALAHERAIDRAEGYIYIEDQYVWPCSLVDRLERALQRGVHVLMVVARDYDAPGLAPISKRLRHEVVARLQKAGGELFQIFHIERDDGKQIYVHSKVIIVDDCYASIGSANFNARSLTNDTELQVGIVDQELVAIPFGGTTQPVCRFAHELRCALWAEHLQLGINVVKDPIDSIKWLWKNAPLAPSKRVKRHDASLSAFSIDPIAEYITTNITEGMASIRFVPLPVGVTQRSAVKLAVDAALRGPQAALLLKVVEELLNPDIAPAVAEARSSLSSALGLRSSSAGKADDLGRQIVARLKAKKLPQMVDWFDPGLLVRIGIRDIISGTIGQYADQRLMQAASDQVSSERDLAARYDYSDVHDPIPTRRLQTDDEGRVWVDYVADLGDGFESTYAMAYLMAKERLDVAPRSSRDVGVSLPAGQILIMGGDQAYPQGTPQEYQARLVDPYSWAYTTDHPSRKLFAIPGNHDWYDGLNAFSSLFTSARDRISGGLGKELGIWRCHQHRSYWAIKLPHKWWIWGPDIQLAGTLDDPQRDYFDIVSDYTRPGDNIIICLAEPSWHHENYDNLHEISMLARKNGAKICAVLAGDWHHYSRYTNSDLGMQFITCGGGGAFAHATHQLKSRVDLEWAEKTEHASRISDAKDPLAFNRMEQHIVKDSDHVDFSIHDYPLSVSGSDAGQPSDSDRESRRRMKSHRDAKHDYGFATFSHHAPRIYPSRTRSRLMALRNLWLPFHNVRFAVLVGIIYFLYAWVFQVSAPPIDVKSAFPTGKMAPQEAVHALTKLFLSVISPQRVVSAAKASPIFFFMLMGLWAGLVYYVELGKGFLNMLGKLIIGTCHFLMHLTALLIVNLNAYLPTVVLAAIESSILGGGGNGTASAVQQFFAEVAFLATYAGVSIFTGGLVGAFIMGLYWTITSTLFNMHCGDAFGALGIRNYKHFLRMCFEPDCVTIYPVAIDKVPGRTGWRASTAAERAETPAQIVPRRPLKPHLIEEPIVIKASAVRS